MNKINLNILQIGSDSSLLTEGSDAFLRMTSYADLVNNLSIIILTDEKSFIRKGNLEIYASGGSNKIFRAVNAFFLAKRLSKNHSYQVVSSQDPIFIGLISLLISNFLGTKLLVSVFGMNVFSKGWLREKWSNRYIKPISLFVLNKADAIQTDTEESFLLLQKRFGEKTFYKPVVPFNLKSFDVDRKYSDEGKNILYVGRLSHEKNIPLLLEVIRKSLELMPDLHFTIIGNGPMKQYLLSYIKNFNSKSNITYIESLSRDQIVEYFKVNDIFILTSYYEGMAKVFMEAGMSGMPIITTDVGGAHDIVIDGETGYIVAGQDPHLFVNKISLIYKDKEHRVKLGENIKKLARTKFNFEAMLEAQKKVYGFLYQ